MADETSWDVFFSYSSPDRAEVERLALRVENEAGLKVFLDRWHLVPGDPFIPELDAAIRASRCCTVFLGKDDVRPWQHQEVQAALNRAVRRSASGSGPTFRVIPVLLPGAVELDEDDLPSFIGLRTWVDFRSGKGLDDEEPFARLVAGIRGVAPGRPITAPPWMAILPVPDLKRPTGLAVDGRVLFVADHEAGTVMRVESGAIVRRLPGLLKPHHLAVVGDTLVATNTHGHEVVMLDFDLAVQGRHASFGDRELRRPHGVTSNFPSEFYLTDSDHHRVLRIEGSAVTAVAGRSDCRRGQEAGEFSVPVGVAAAPDSVLVADTYNHRVQVLTRDLRPLSVFGSPGDGPGQFQYPVGVAVWHHWILVADEHNKRLQLWRRESTGLPYTATCVSSDICRDWIGSPFGLTFDSDGQLFVSDRKNGQVVQIAFDSMLEAHSWSADGHARG
jgi:sugar lactone lactonase YvrE